VIAYLTRTAVAHRYTRRIGRISQKKGDVLDRMGRGRRKGFGYRSSKLLGELKAWGLGRIESDLYASVESYQYQQALK